MYLCWYLLYITEAKQVELTIFFGTNCQGYVMITDITFSLYLMKRKKKADGTIPIYLRITQQRKSRYLSTKIYINEDHWNPKANKVRKNHPRHKALNQQLDDFIHDVKQTLHELPEEKQKAHTLKKALKKKPDVNFFDLSDEMAAYFKVDGNFNELRNLKTLRRKLEHYNEGNILEIKEIDVEFLEGFVRYLQKIGNANNTIIKEMKKFRRVYKMALKRKLVSVDPFLTYEGVKKQPTNKDRLSFEQIEAIRNLELPRGTGLEKAKDAFLFSFFNAGIRFGDLCRLTWAHIVDGRLKYNMGKTGKGKNIKLLAPALSIIQKYKVEGAQADDYIFPFLDSRKHYPDELAIKKQISSKNAIVNKNLKKIAAMAGIQENLSTHIARHSFADYARKKKINIYDISKALGHSDITITQAYLKSFDETSLDESMNELFGE